MSAMDANSGAAEGETAALPQDTPMHADEAVFSTSPVSIQPSDTFYAADVAPRPFPSASVASFSSSDRQGADHPQSILVRREPVIQVTVTVPEVPSAASAGPAESPLLTEPPRLGISGSIINSRASSLSSDSSTSSARGSTASSSSVCTRTTATSAMPASLCVSFAPLPSLEPRVRKSKRPLGIAARGEMLRQRRMAMQAQADPYYDNSDDDLRDTIPGSARRRANKVQEEAIVEDPFVSLGRALNGATKVIWRRLASNKPKGVDGQQQQRAPGGRGFSLRIRRRADSTGPRLSNASDSDDDSDDEHWRRKNEDPMTKTIMEGDEHGFILAYDEVEEEEDVELTRAHDEIRSTVEMHVVDSLEVDHAL